MKFSLRTLLFSFTILSFSCFTQESKNTWGHELSLSDTLLIWSKKQRASQINRTNLDSALILTSQCESRGKQLLTKFKKPVVNRRLAFIVKDVLNVRALALAYNDFSAEAEEEFKRGLAHENKYELGGQAHICNNIAYCQCIQFKYGEAVDFTEKSINYSKAISNPTRKEVTVLLHSYNSLASIYRKLQDYKKTLLYLKKCEELIPKIGKSKSVPVTYSFIARVYLKHFSDTLNSRKYYGKALESIKTIKTPRNETHAYIGLADLYMTDSTDLSDAYLDKADSVLKDYNFVNEACLLLFYRSSVAYQRKQFQKAIEYSNACLEKTGGKFALTRLKAYKILELCYQQKGDWEKVYEYGQIVKRIADSSLNLENQKNALEMKSKWDFQRYQQKVKRQKQATKSTIQKLNKEKQWSQSVIVWCIVGILFALGITLFLFVFFKRKLRQKESHAESELKLLLSEINLLREKMSSKLVEDNSLNAEILNKNLEFVMKTSLSKREMDVLLELCKGKENKEIADSLFISVNTVRTHLLKIYNKMDVKNRSQAINKANNLNQL